MKRANLETSPQIYARIEGVLYLVIIAAGLFGETFVRGRLIVVGDPLATAHRILGSELLFRAGIAGDLLMHLCDVPSILIFYLLLRPVNRNLSLLAALFNLIQTAVLAANKLNLLAVLLLLQRPSMAKAFAPQQLASLASFALALHGNGFALGLIFFGVRCLIVGYLIARSQFFPRTLGVLQAIAGVCYLVNSFLLILAPPLADKLFPAILLPAFAGELAMALWLLFKGVDVAKWSEAVARNAPAQRASPGWMSAARQRPF